MRLIDAERLDVIFASYEGYDVDSYIAGMRAVTDAIDSAPTVDAVQVVRCKDCRWYDKVDWCNKLRISGIKEFKEIWFCADGERRIDE